MNKINKICGNCTHWRNDQIFADMEKLCVCSKHDHNNKTSTFKSYTFSTFTCKSFKPNNMKLIKKTFVNGLPILTVQTRFLFLFNKTTTYRGVTHNNTLQFLQLKGDFIKGEEYVKLINLLTNAQQESIADMILKAQEKNDKTKRKYTKKRKDNANKNDV